MSGNTVLRGMVEYEADFFMLRPADSARGNRKLIYHVTNRGRKFLLTWLMEARTPSPAAANDPRTLEDAATGSSSASAIRSCGAADRFVANAKSTDTAKRFTH